MQFRQWVTFFSSSHSRLPQTPIFFQQSSSLTVLMDSKLRFGSSALISFAPEYGPPGFLKRFAVSSRRIYPSIMRSVSAHHSDQARDRGPFDKTLSPAADLPQSRGSTRVNESRVPKG